MSKQSVKTISCPICNNINKINIYNSINVKNEPGLKTKLMQNKLFFYKCDSCSAKINLKFSCLYNDMENGFMIYFYPFQGLYKIDCSKEISSFPFALKIDKRLVNSINSLKEKILIFENNLDDLAIEVYKLLILKSYDSKEIKKISFSKIDKTNNLYFSIVFNNEKKSVIKKVKFELYKHISNFILNNRETYIEDNKFFITNKTMIQKILSDYKKNPQNTKINIDKLI